MSRAYRIQVKESETRNVKTDDEICTQLEILEILPPEDMEVLLKEELKKKGFTEQPDGSMVRNEEDGTTIVVEPCGEVRIKVEKTEQISKEADKEGRGWDDMGPDQKSMRQTISEELKKKIDKQFEEDRKRMQEEVSKKLEQKIQEIQPELGQVINQLTKEALKQKAHKMGTITEISENEAGDMTIKLEV